MKCVSWIDEGMEDKWKWNIQSNLFCTEKSIGVYLIYLIHCHSEFFKDKMNEIVNHL